MAPNIFSYTIDHDRGLAPNPFHGICSLAVCKPEIRNAARRDDYVVGTSSYNKRKKGIGGRAIFVMRVTDRICFDEYYREAQYARKRANMAGSRKYRCGDAIYHHDPVTGGWVQDDSLHRQKNGQVSLANLRVDTGRTDRLLLSTDFVYWGANAPFLPPHLNMFGAYGVRTKRYFSEKEVNDFIAWAKPQLGQGLVGLPIDWLR